MSSKASYARLKQQQAVAAAATTTSSAAFAAPDVATTAVCTQVELQPTGSTHVCTTAHAASWPWIVMF